LSLALSPLRVCKDCGKEAHSEEDLLLFKKDKKGLHGRAQLCTLCHNARSPKAEKKPYLRKCFVCGVEATTKLTLHLFRKDQNMKHGRANICRDCYNKEYFQKYYTQSKERIVNHSRTNCKSLRLKALDVLSDNPTCIWCGYGDERSLCIDHIHDNGNEERKTHSMNKIYRLISEMSREVAQKDYQLLCRNCNWIKEMER